MKYEVSNLEIIFSEAASVVHDQVQPLTTGGKDVVLQRHRPGIRTLNIFERSDNQDVPISIITIETAPSGNLAR